MRFKTLAVAAACLAASAASQAAVQSLRSFMQGADMSQAQSAGAMWTGRVGDAGGVLLPSTGSNYAYPGPYYNNFGPLVNVGDATWGSGAYAPSFDGIFIHPGWDASQSTDAVFTAQEAVTLTGVTVFAEMVVNGASSNGIDIEVRHIRGSVVTSLGHYVVGGPSLSTQAFSFGSGLLFAAGDQVEVDVGSNGSYYYDHLNLNVELSAAAANPVPEPETYALMLAGLAAIGFAVRRRQR
jgi:hypothetical protein